MRSTLHALLAAALLAGGAVTGRFVFGSTTGKVVDESGVSQRPSRPQSAPASPVVEGAGKRDLASIRGHLKQDGGPYAGIRADLERMGSATLRQLVLDRISALSSLVDEGERRPHHILLDAALEVLWKRDGTAALEWASGLPEKAERGTALMELLEKALRDDAAAALPWMEKYHAEYGRSATNNEFLSIAMKGAVERGADEVIRVFAMFSGTTLINPLYTTTYPEGFDFAKLHAALAGKLDLRDPITEWALRDREAAWAAIKGHLETPAPHTNPVTILMMAVSSQEGEAAGVKWMLDRLSTLPEEQRKEQIQKLNQQGDTMSAEGIAALAGSLPPAERLEYASDIVKKVGTTPRSYAVLDTLPKEDILKALRANLRGSNQMVGPASGTPVYTAWMDRIIGEVRGRYQLTTEEAADLRALQDP